MNAASNQPDSGERFRDLLGNRLRALRTDRRWPLKRVAAELGVSSAIVSSWERGTRFPSGAHLFMLADVFELPVCQLMYFGREVCPQADGAMTRVNNRWKKGALTPRASA